MISLPSVFPFSNLSKVSNFFFLILSSDKSSSSDAILKSSFSSSLNSSSLYVVGLNFFLIELLFLSISIKISFSLKTLFSSWEDLSFVISFFGIAIMLFSSGILIAIFILFKIFILFESVFIFDNFSSEFLSLISFSISSLEISFEVISVFSFLVSVKLLFFSLILVSSLCNLRVFLLFFLFFVFFTVVIGCLLSSDTLVSLFLSLLLSFISLFLFFT